MGSLIDISYITSSSAPLHLPSIQFDTTWRSRCKPAECQSIQATIWPHFTKTHPRMWPQRFQIATGARLSSTCSKCIVGDTPHGLVEVDGLLSSIVKRGEKEMGYITIDINEQTREVAKYCLKLLMINFYGQTSVCFHESDQARSQEVLNLGLYLNLLNKFLRQFDDVTQFTGEEEEYQVLLRLISMKRCQKGKETNFKCYQRLRKDSKRFVAIFQSRGVPSMKLQTEEYWGTRQQLMAGKVISDWVDKEYGPLDPIFGVLLQPTAGRVGPGDSGLMHEVLFDDNGYMAYHSAVHDAFGYLINNHNLGPGYDYLAETMYFDTLNPLAGQLSGIQFWQHALCVIGEEKQVINHWRC